MPTDVQVNTSTNERGQYAPYCYRVLGMEGKTGPSDPAVPLVAGDTREVEWTWPRDGNVAGVWIMTRNATAEELAGLTLQISSLTEPFGTQGDEANNVPWPQLMQQGIFWEWMPLNVEVQANVHPWTLSLTNAGPSNVRPGSHLRFRGVSMMTRQEAFRMAEVAVARALTQRALGGRSTGNVSPAGFGIEGGGERAPAEGSTDQSNDDYLCVDSLSTDRIVQSAIARGHFSYKTKMAGRSADFFINSPVLQRGLQASGQIARVELWALQGSTRALMAVGSTRGMGEPADGFAGTANAPIGHWIASARAAHPCQWEAILYFRVTGAVLDFGPTQIALSVDPVALPEAPPSIGTVPYYNTLSLVRLPDLAGIANPPANSDLLGGLAPPRLVSIAGAHLSAAPAAPLFLQVLDTIRTGALTIPTTTAEIELALIAGAPMVQLGARELEALDFRGNSGGNFTLGVSTTSGTFTGAADGSAWWQVIWR